MYKQYEKKNQKGSKKPVSGNTHQYTQNDTKKYQAEKHQAMMEYMDSGSINSPPFTTDQYQK